MYSEGETVTIHTVQFAVDGQNDYLPLLTAFRRSVRQNMPGVDFREHRLSRREHVGVRHVHYGSNTYKLNAWERIVRRATDPLVLADCDMLALRSIEDAFDAERFGDFDIAYTVTSNPRLPLNGGLIFVRPTPASQRFFRVFREINTRMYWDPIFHTPWRNKTAGMNQAAFWYVVQTIDHGARLATFPCREWNACQDDWAHMGPECRMLHVKGQLRRACLGGAPLGALPSELRKPAEIWRRYAI